MSKTDGRKKSKHASKNGGGRRHTSTVHVKMEPELYRRLEDLCRTNVRSMSGQIRMLISAACDKEGIAA